MVEGELAVLVRHEEGSGSRSAVRGGTRGTLPFAGLGTEPPLQTATSLVREGTGRSATWIAQSATLTEGAHPAGATLLIVYAAVVPVGTPPRGGSAWAKVSALPPLAPREAKAVDAAVASLRDRMDLAPIAFRLLPDRFTLGELQEAYELLLDRRLHKASFRRALASAALVEATDDWRSEGRGRPAQLFRYSPRRRRGTRRPVRFELLA